MPPSRKVRAWRSATAVFGVASIALGCIMAVTAVARGGGPASLGVVIGVLFVLLGAGRLYILRLDPWRER